MRREQPSDAQLGLSRLLNPVVQKSEGALLAQDEPGVDGFPESRVHRLFSCPVNQGQSGDLGDVAQAGELFQGFLRGDGESLQLPGHEVHDVISVALGADVIDVPLPAWRDWVEREQPLFGQRRKELDREKWITTGLLLHQLRQGPCALRPAMQRIVDEPVDIIEPEGCQHYLTHPHIGIADRIEGPQKRVRRTDLVVPVGSDQKQMPDLGMRDHVFDALERRGIKPLQIEKKQRERVLLAREPPEEAPENHLEAVLRVLRRQVRDRWLSPNHELQLGNEVDDQLTIRTQRLAQGVPPPAKLGLALAQERADEALEGLA